jgi:DNA repair exonuclease SbcCD nuclease subunit
MREHENQANTMMKILLTSDLHLGIKNNVPIPDVLRLTTFKKIATLARNHHLLLIAGDLIESKTVTRETLDIISQVFDNLRKNNIDIVFTPGEADFDDRGKLPSYFYNLNISHIFTESNCTIPYTFSHDDETIHLYGIPAKADINIDSITRAGEEGFHLGLFHLHFNSQGGTRNAVPVLTSGDIKRLQFNFYALGHHHHFKLIKYLNKLIGAYPGTPEATGRDETGDRYVLSLTIKDNELYQLKRLNVNTTKINDLQIECDKHKDDSHIIEQLIKNRSPKDILVLTLTGERNFFLDHNELQIYQNNYLKLIIDDRSIPRIEVLIEEFKDEDSLRGEFFSILKEKIDEGNIPSTINTNNLSFIINNIIRAGTYIPEEWLCI